MAPIVAWPHSPRLNPAMIISETVKLFKMFLRTIRGMDTPRQMAFGLAMGMMIGLIPKDSLLVYFFGFVLLCTTANLFWATVGGFTFSWIGHWIAPMAHQVGLLVLTFDPLEATWTYLIEQPFVAWTRFDHTIVMGSLVIGIVAFWPVYQISRSLFEAYAPKVSRRLRRSRIYKWVVETEPVTPTKNAA